MGAQLKGGWSTPLNFGNELTVRSSVLQGRKNSKQTRIEGQPRGEGWGQLKGGWSTPLNFGNELLKFCFAQEGKTQNRQEPATNL